LFAAEEEEEDATDLFPLLPGGWTFSLALLETMTAFEEVAASPALSPSAAALAPSPAPSSSTSTSSSWSSTLFPVVVVVAVLPDDPACSLSSLALLAAMSAKLSFSLVGFVGTLITAEVLDLVGVR
jgi:hypothetical protein